MKEYIEEGARNCVADCAQVKRGNSVLILNQSGSVDSEVSNALAQAAKDSGAQIHVLWGEPIPKSDETLPKTLIGALLASDVAIVTYPSLRREVLHPYIKDREVARSGNAARTTALMGSEWARFPYHLEDAIINRLDEIMEQAKLWRITTAEGTDIRGEFRGKESVIAGAYFERDDGNTRFSRSFPGGVHTPFNSGMVEGVIMVEHLSSLATQGNALALDRPFRIEVKGNEVVAIEEGEKGGEILRQQIEERKEGVYHFIDSWHAGTNPKTVVPWDRKKEPRVWWNYAHWSPLALHFHLGRSVNPITLCCFNQTVWVDGRKLYEDGKLAILDDIEGIAKRYSEDLFANNPLPM
jgi:hypothetical protein